MRLLFVGAVISLSVIGSAIALQETTPSADASRFVADLERRPDAGLPPGPIYPQHALRVGASGVVHLCCTAGADRTLACEVAREWPDDEGFGSRALQLADTMRLTEASHQLYLTRPDARVHLPVRFNLRPLSDDFARESQRIEAEAATACGASNGPTEPLVISAERVGRQRR
jgi:hypothetical protein